MKGITETKASHQWARGNEYGEWLEFDLS